MRHSPVLLLTLFLAAACAAPRADAAPETFASEHGGLTVTTVADGLEHPWGMAFLPDGRMLVTERAGRLRVVTQAGEVSPPVQGVPAVWAVGQGGLLDVAIDPDYATNGLIYFSYAEPGPDGNSGGTAVARGRLDLAGNRVSDVQVLFRQVPKATTPYHFGSRLAFAPDGTLFITTGERGQRPGAQDPRINRGQVIRINRDGTIPRDNPFVGHTDYRPEVWSYGHRNMQGAAIHPGTGKLWTHEHGARGGDEINVPAAGKNYGWPVIAYGRHYSGAKIGVGTHNAGMEQPIYYWDPSIAPSGMAFYTGDLFPAWQGNLLVGALKYRMLVRLELDGERVAHEERLLQGIDQRIRAVVQGPEGAVYLLTDEDPGRVLRLTPAAG